MCFFRSCQQYYSVILCFIKWCAQCKYQMCSFRHINVKLASNSGHKHCLKRIKIHSPTSTQTCALYAVMTLKDGFSLSPRVISPLCADTPAACLSGGSRPPTQASGLNARHTWIESGAPTHSPGDVVHSILRQAAKSLVQCEDLSNSSGPGTRGVSCA